MSEDAPEVIADAIIEPVNENDVEARIAELEDLVQKQAESLIPSAEESKNIAAAARLNTVNLGTVAQIAAAIKLARGTGQRNCTTTKYDGVRKVLQYFRAKGYVIVERPHPQFEHGLLDITW